MLELLLGERWSVELADGGPAAWSIALAAPPDLVISDVRMPGMDGIALLRRLRATPATQNVPVILVSARAGEQETIAGLEAGADDFLVKPFSGRELMVRVQTRLEVTAMRRRNVQQEEALAGLQRSTEWTETLLDSLPVPLLLLEPGSAVILFANHAARRLTGSPLDARDGARRPRLAAAPGRGSGRRRAWSRGRSRRPPRRRPGAQPPGGLAALRQSVRPAAPAGGLGAPARHARSRAGAVLTLQDVSELVRKESALRSTLRMRDEFLSVASHELRTPITTLTLQTDVALKACADGEAAPPGTSACAAALVSIRTQVDRLEQLIDALLDVSRLIEGRLELHPEELDLRSVAEDAIETIREPASRAGSAVRLSAGPGVTGRWDRLRVGQVVTNLLSNAVKFGCGQPIDVAIETEGDAGLPARPRQRPRHPARSADPHLRALRARFVRAALPGAGPRALDRQADRGRLPRQHLGRQPAGRGLDVRGSPPAGAMSRRMSRP